MPGYMYCFILFQFNLTDLIFLTTIAHHIEIQMYMTLGNIPLERNLNLCVVGMLRHLLFAYD